MTEILLDRHRRLGREAVLDALMEIETRTFSDPWRREMFSSSMAVGNVRFFTAEEEGAIVGYLLLMEIAPEGEILNLAVDPDRRRQGIGDRLMAAALGYARDREIETLFLEVRESNLAAQSLYRKAGFRAVGRRKRYYRNPTEDAILMMLPSEI